MSLTKQFFIFFVFFLIHQASSCITIMIDPIGDANNTGREIQDSFERSLTLQCAQELKQLLEAQNSSIQVVLTRTLGDNLQPLQNASFANRLNVDLFVSISFYQQHLMPCHLSVFYYLENPADVYHKYNPLMFYPADQAHLINIAITPKFAALFCQQLKQATTNSAFVCRGPFAAPCVPLLAVKSPALLIEAGLLDKNDWKYIVNPIAQAIVSVIS